MSDAMYTFAMFMKHYVSGHMWSSDDSTIQMMRENPNFIFEFVEGCFQHGLRVTDRYASKNVCEILIDSLIEGYDRGWEYVETIRYEDAEKIERLLALCMHGPTFEARIRTFLDDIRANPNGMNEIRGYLIHYARMNGYNTASVDYLLQQYDPLHPNEADEYRWQNAMDIHRAYAELRYWAEHVPSRDNTRQEHQGESFSMSTFLEESKRLRAELIEELNSDDDKKDFRKICQRMKSYMIHPSSVRISSNGRTILMDACRQSDTKTITKLIGMGANIYEMDVYGRRARDYATIWANERVVSLLDSIEANYSL